MIVIVKFKTLVIGLKLMSTVSSAFLGEECQHNFSSSGRRCVNTYKSFEVLKIFVCLFSSELVENPVLAMQ